MTGPRGAKTPEYKRIRAAKMLAEGFSCAEIERTIGIGRAMLVKLKKQWESGKHVPA